MQAILALPSLDLSWCNINGEPLSFVGPTVPPQLVVSRPPLTNLLEIRSKQAAYIIMWIFGKTSFLLPDTHAPKLACFRSSDRE